MKVICSRIQTDQFTKKVQILIHLTKNNSKDTSSSLVRDSSVVAKLDMSSVKRYAIMGTVCISPLLTKWYGWLDGKFPCTTTRVVIKKLFLDQFIFTPVVVVVFYVGMY